MGDPLCEQSEHHDQPPKSIILVEIYRNKQTCCICNGNVARCGQLYHAVPSLARESSVLASRTSVPGNLWWEG